MVGQSRATQRYVPTIRADEDALTKAIVALAEGYGATAGSQPCSSTRAGWWVRTGCSGSGVVRGSKSPRNNPNGLNDGSCIRLRPTHPQHVWSYDFVHYATDDGRSLKLLTLIDEATRECLAIRVGRCVKGPEVIETLSDAMLFHGIPEHIRSDNGPEMTSKLVRNWLQKMGTQTLFIEPGSPWENGYNESFNGKLRGECLNAEIFYTLKEAQIIIEQWRRHYNTIRPHSALGYRPPAPETIIPIDPRQAMH